MQERESELLKKRLARHWLKRATRQIISYSQVSIALGGLVVAIALRVPWLSGLLRQVGLTDANAVIQTVVAVILVSIFFDLRSLLDRDDLSVKEELHFADPMDVYPVLIDRIRLVAKQEHKTLDVIGMTLYTAWPSVRFWLNRSELAGWTVRLAAVVHGEQELAEHVPAAWFRDSKANLNSVLECATLSAIKEKGIKLEPYGYNFMPALHGYRLGNGDLFYSLLLWQADGKLGFDGYSYEFVPAEDLSSSAEAIRGVFESWFLRASKTPWTGAQS